MLGSASTTLDLPFTFSEIRAMVKFLSRRVGQNPRQSSIAYHDSFIPASNLLTNIHPLASGWKYSISLKRDSGLSENSDFPASKKENYL